MALHNEKSTLRASRQNRSSDLLETLMTGLDEPEREATANTISRQIREDRAAAFKARAELADEVRGGRSRTN